ncbi:MAG TPA: hypothetical protein VHF26_01275, partial [Trebonia sp.]|nr:hypothetical protein [Trebonia sp.]
MNFLFGGSLTMLFSGSLKSGAGTSAAVQLQPKIAVVAKGAMRRFKVELDVSGEVHAQRNIRLQRGWKFIGRGHRQLNFGGPGERMLLQGELLLPADQAEDFLAQIRGTAPRTEPAAAAAQNTQQENGQRQNAQQDGQRPARLRGALLGDTGRLTDYGALLTRVEALVPDDDRAGDDYVVLRVPPGFLDRTANRRLTGEQWDTLERLSEQGRVRILESPEGDGVARFRVFRRPGPAGSPGGAWDADASPVNDADVYHHGRLGYDLDARGIRAGWSVIRPQDGTGTHRFAMAPNPDYDRYPSASGRLPLRAPLENSRSHGSYQAARASGARLDDILRPLTVPGPAVNRTFGVVSGRLRWRAGTADHLEDLSYSESHPNGEAASGVPNAPAERRVEGRLKRYVYGAKLLRTPDDGHYDVPDTGFEVNDLGQVMSGWRPARAADGFTVAPQWDSEELTGTGAVPDITATKRAFVAGLLKKARVGGGGVQLVVDPDGVFADDLRAAVSRHLSLPVSERALFLNTVHAQVLTDEMVDGLTLNDALEVLVTSPNVRIVGENGVVLGPETNGDGQFTGAVHAYPVSPSVRLGEEFSVRPDGGVSRSVGWRPGVTAETRDAFEVASVRRARLDADPQSETAEIAAGVGLGTASFLEMPGAERVQGAIRDRIIAMAEGHAGWFGTSRFKKFQIFQRWGLDKKLQTALAAPALRGARGEGMENGLRTEVELNGRKYLIGVSSYLQARVEMGTRTGTQLDQQVKASLMSAAEISRAYGIEFETAFEAARIGASHPGVATATFTAGEFAGAVEYERNKAAFLNFIGKMQTRTQASGDRPSFRPEYRVGYKWNVTEIKPGGLLRKERRRTEQGEDVPVQASGVVHSDYRPVAARTRERGFRSAFDHIVATIGRTSVLGAGDFDRVRNGVHGQLRGMDFSRTGTIGLFGYFSGLKGVADQVQEMVLGPGAEERSADIDQMFTDAFFRSNLHRLLSPNGLAITLRGRRGRFINVGQSVRVKAVLADADDAADFDAPNVPIEHYTESDTRAKHEDTNTVSGRLTAGVGGNVKWGAAATESSEPGLDGSGGTTSENADTGGRRTVADGVSLGVSASASRNLRGRTVSASDGSLDLGLGREPEGMKVRRKHL